MLLDYIFVEVVILVNEVNPWEGGLQEIVPDDQEVKLELEAVALVILQVDIAFSVLAHTKLFDAGAFHASLSLID